MRMRVCVSRESNPACSVDLSAGGRLQGVVTQALTIGTFATGVKMRSRGQSKFLVSVKRSRPSAGAKRVKVKRLSRLQTQDLRCFIPDIRRF